MLISGDQTTTYGLLIIGRSMTMTNDNHQEIEQEIKGYILSQFLLDQPGATVDNDLPLIRQGIVDSLGIFLLITFLNERFGVEVEPDEVVLENFETVAAIKRLVLSKQ
jgi:acyl carrier protein